MIWNESNIIQKAFDCYDKEKLLGFFKEQVTEEKWSQMTMKEICEFKIEGSAMGLGELFTIISGVSAKSIGMKPKDSLSAWLTMGLYIWPESRVIRKKLAEVEEKHIVRNALINASLQPPSNGNE